MKNILLYTCTFAALLTGMVACDKIAATDDVPHTQSARLTVQDTLVKVPATAGVASNIVVVSGDNKNWNVTSNDSWIKVSKGQTNTNGVTESTVEIAVEANTYYSRYGSVTLTLEGSSASRTFRVLQESALGDPYITIGDNNQLNIRAAQLDTALTVSTNQSVYEVNTEASWITFTKTANQLTVHIAENEGLVSRVDSFTVVAGTTPHIATTKIVIRQAKPDSEDEITINGIEFVRVKAGSFFMGAQNTNAGGTNYYSAAAANQMPVHKVNITKDFYIGKYELTQAQYQAVIGSNPSSTKGLNNPVEMVDYNEAVNFTSLLSQQVGVTFRLPTEAEWEYAARGGSASHQFIYSGSNNPLEVAYHFTTGGTERADEITKPVGSYLPNSLGIYDMSGNVYEWCLDKQVSYTAAEKTDPVGTTGNNILRGGSWYHNAASQAVSYRGSNSADFKRAYLGFRIIYVPEQ
ncbi:SUMF1/EgtB/PvdO family nonheme iron enzyme [Gynurincola endophyticus]|uniref:SUMF1/EgtB/PvdO family nonheme iron enzyme n=1 Tax=Gynurincola endophyticus TaxID=2479004 RepID=UPI000F8EB95D|nr:SUMF1/EgtB/PvdO family nonheme iron enzyme [Gynurincola endophyticus]